MKTITLSNDYETLVSDEDYAWLSQWKWSLVSNYVRRAGFYRNVWVRNGYSRKLISMHRLILLRQGISLTGKEADHINGRKLDNRRENLRAVTKSQNIINIRNRSDNTSGERGVYYHKVNDRWVAQITKDKKQIYLGAFRSFQEASDRRREAARELFGEFNPKELY